MGEISQRCTATVLKNEQAAEQMYYTCILAGVSYLHEISGRIRSSGSWPPSG